MNALSERIIRTVLEDRPFDESDKHHLHLLVLWSDVRALATNVPAYREKLAAAEVAFDGMSLILTVAIKLRSYVSFDSLLRLGSDPFRLDAFSGRMEGLEAAIKNDDVYVITTVIKRHGVAALTETLFDRVLANKAYNVFRCVVRASLFDMTRETGEELIRAVIGQHWSFLPHLIACGVDTTSAVAPKNVIAHKLVSRWLNRLVRYDQVKTLIACATRLPCDNLSWDYPYDVAYNDKRSELLRCFRAGNCRSFDYKTGEIVDWPAIDDAEARQIELERGSMAMTAWPFKRLHMLEAFIALQTLDLPSVVALAIADEIDWRIEHVPLHLKSFAFIACQKLYRRKCAPEDRIMMTLDEIVDADSADAATVAVCSTTRHTWRN